MWLIGAGSLSTRAAVIVAVHRRAETEAANESGATAWGKTGGGQAASPLSLHCPCTFLPTAAGRADSSVCLSVCLS